MTVLLYFGFLWSCLSCYSLSSPFWKLDIYSVPLSWSASDFTEVHIKEFTLSLRTDLEFEPWHIVGNAEAVQTLADTLNVFLRCEMVTAFRELSMECSGWIWSVSYKLIPNALFSLNGTTFTVMPSLGDGDRREEMDQWLRILGYMLCLAPFPFSAPCDIGLNHSDFLSKNMGAKQLWTDHNFFLITVISIRCWSKKGKSCLDHCHLDVVGSDDCDSTCKYIYSYQDCFLYQLHCI